MNIKTHRIYFVSACLALLIVFHGKLVAQTTNKTRPNILLIVADDLSKTLGIYGDHTIQTPNIEAIAKEGVIFEHAYCTASSCTPSRASMLTGRYPHQLSEGANLWGTLPYGYQTYTRILAANGYRVGLEGKGWGPGDFTKGGYTENPAGKSYSSFGNFLSGQSTSAPFCFWLGSHDPHRPYSATLKDSVHFDLKSLKVPVWMPDEPDVRTDLLDYYAAAKRFDDTVGKAIALLKQKGLYDKTLIIVTSDNGMPFARAKANNYEISTIIPLVIRYGQKFINGKRIDELVSLVDLAPTILEVTGLAVPTAMTGKSMLPLLYTGKSDTRYEQIFTERERHARVREGNLSYPIRAVRTKDFLYIKNLRPERWPAGDPDSKEKTGAFGDIDPGLSKDVLVKNRKKPGYETFAAWSLDKRPDSELYDLRKDPYQLKNLAGDPAFVKIAAELDMRLTRWMKQTGDPLLKTGTEPFDAYPYYGGKPGGKN